MRLSDWTVIKYVDEDFHRYIYGDLCEYMIECGNSTDFKIIPFDKWTNEDCIALMTNLFQDINRHALIKHLEYVVETMKDLDMCDINTFLRFHTIKVFDMYGY